MAHWLTGLLFVALATGMFIACRSQRKPVNPKPVEKANNLSKPAPDKWDIIRPNSEIVYPEHEFKAFTAKAKMNYRDPEQNMAATLNIHLAPDSLIWISVSPALGIEAVRCLFRPDSVFMLDRYHKTAYAYNYKALSRMMRVKLGFDFFQALILGEKPLGEGKPEKQSPDSAFTRIVQYWHPAEAITQWDSIHRQTQRFNLKNTQTTETFILENSELKPVEQGFYAFRKHINITWPDSAGNRQEANIKLQFSKVQFPKQRPAFNFEVPTTYKREH